MIAGERVKKERKPAGNGNRKKNTGQRGTEKVAKNRNVNMITGERVMSDSNETGQYLITEMQRWGARGVGSSWWWLAAGPIDVRDEMQ
jgi:hypothetical protein